MSNFLDSLREKVLMQILADYGLLVEAYPEEYSEIWKLIGKIKLVWVKEARGYVSKVNNHAWLLRINLKSGDPRYTLHIGQESILSFDHLPETWKLVDK